MFKGQAPVVFYTYIDEVVAATALLANRFAVSF